MSQREYQKQFSVWISKDHYRRLKELTAKPGITLTTILERMIDTYQPEPEPISEKCYAALLKIVGDLESRIAALEQQSSQNLYQSNSIIDSPIPSDRAALAALVRERREQGLSFKQIADGLNDRGWTPDKIPGKTGNRVDASPAWTEKTLSQLLNRVKPS